MLTDTADSLACALQRYNADRSEESPSKSNFHFEQI